jgi:hypothetical protein
MPEFRVAVDGAAQRFHIGSGKARSLKLGVKLSVRQGAVSR